MCNPNGQSAALRFGGAVTEVGENDIICGRGGLALRHPGNMAYRKLVSLNKELYASESAFALPCVLRPARKCTEADSDCCLSFAPESLPEVREAQDNEEHRDHDPEQQRPLPGARGRKDEPVAGRDRRRREPGRVEGHRGQEGDREDGAGLARGAAQAAEEDGSTAAAEGEPYYREQPHADEWILWPSGRRYPPIDAHGAIQHIYHATSHGTVRPYSTASTDRAGWLSPDRN